MFPVDDYLKKLANAYSIGNATEHTYRAALQEFVQSVLPGIVATNEPKRSACGAPDYIVTKGNVPLGYIEAKDIDVQLSKVERDEQMKRYLGGLSNIILTDYLEFRWYVNGQHRETGRMASVVAGKIKANKIGCEQVVKLLELFLTTSTPTVNSPSELAGRMAKLARIMRNSISLTLAEEMKNDDAHGTLYSQFDGFRQTLIHDLQPEAFADMYTQTICYGMFAARCNAGNQGQFSRQSAGQALPKTNPFLRRMFDHIAGIDLDDRIAWAVDDLAELLGKTDMEAILANFGKRTRREDPVVHFYESFLAAYDPAMRESRGVYYTPEPVVTYIVHSIDHILKTAFNLPDGLADSSRIGDANSLHKVQILDPATGTGTFLHNVVEHIHESFLDEQGMWSGYVAKHLLPRLHGFELLMAPYTVAHLKLGLFLKETGYDLQSSERLRIYLTNTLEEAHSKTDSLIAHWIADEANAASGVKKDKPVMVVLGNPPYSGNSANTGEWISGLLRGVDKFSNTKTANYFEVDGHSLDERNPKWLNDDYVKFIRFAQWRIEQTGYGVMAFISNHGYLDNPTFRGMRQSLMETFDDIYILDLHGNSKRKEKALDGGKDENVFDIQQGVVIGIFVKKENSGGEKTLRHFGLQGLRKGKYEYLSENSTATTEWAELTPQAPFYLFVPQDRELLPEYEMGWKVSDSFPVNSVGIVTARDKLTIKFDAEDVWNTVNTFASLSEEVARNTFQLGPDARDWKVTLAQADLKKTVPDKGKIVPILYRPFDKRYTYYTGNSRGFHCMPRNEVMQHLLAGENLGLIVMRQVAVEGNYCHFLTTNTLVDNRAFYSNKGIMSMFPLYLYPESATGDQHYLGMETDRKANLSPKFIADFSAKLEMTYIPDGKGNLSATFGPEDVFDYLYAVFHSPTYRSRYAEFLKMDFPRLPLTSKTELFRQLCQLGAELVGLHLMERKIPDIAKFPLTGDDTIAGIRYSEPTEAEKGKVWINADQYFDGVSTEVWNFHVGGYQVCHKWLKDRKGRVLDIDEKGHYKQIVAALAETIRLMAEVEVAIAEHGGWPIE